MRKGGGSVPSDAAFGTSEDELIRRIDLALRAQPLPPERLLRHIIHELRRARGEPQRSALDSVDSAGDWYDDDGRASLSSRGSSRSHDRGSYRSHDYDVGGSIGGSSFTDSVSSCSSLKAEHTSLQIGNRADPVQSRYVARHQDRVLKPPPNNRELDVRKLQDMMIGVHPGYSKNLHADFVSEGRPTQIGGFQTTSKSMIPDLGPENKGVLREIAGLYAKGKPPANSSNATMAPHPKEGGRGDFRH